MNIHGVELKDSGDMVVQAYKRGNDFEPESVMEWITQCSKPGAIALDIGAYTGLYSFVARKHGAIVYAFEPNPANYERLIANTRINHNGSTLTCFNSAVSDRPGRGTVWDIKGRPPLTSAGKVCASDNGSVNMMTIDGLSLTACTVIKADVEGAELEVLQGAYNTISKYLPCLILEANTEAERESLDIELSKHGYGPGVRADARNLIYNHA